MFEGGVDTVAQEGNGGMSGEKSYVGKYVCYGNKEGLFCWGKIEAEGIVNTAKGLRGVFILVDRMSGPHNGSVTRIQGRTTIRKEMLDLEHDIFDKEAGLEDLTDDQLFLLVLSGEIDGELHGAHRGLVNMIQAKAGSGLEEIAKAELNRRVGNKEEP